MKKATITLAIAALLLPGCASERGTLDQRRAEISWSSFCAARGYDPSDRTFPATNEYLDTWCGSTEEEAALTKAGLQPY